MKRALLLIHLLMVAHALPALANDGPALLEAIRKNPMDDTARLVYADWLEEHGQGPRAEFIRVQVDLARFSSHAQYVKLSDQSKKLLREHEREWLPPEFPGHLHSALVWERGFPSSVTLSAADLRETKVIDALNKLPFLNSLKLDLGEVTGGNATGVREHLRKLTLLERIPYVTVNLSGIIEPIPLRTVLSALSPIRHLELRADTTQFFGADEVSALKVLPNLEALELSGFTVLEAVLGRLGRSSTGKRLKSLSLATDSMAPFLPKDHFPNLEELHLSLDVTFTPPRNLAEFFRSDKFSQLKALNLPALDPLSVAGRALEGVASGRNRLVRLWIGGEAWETHLPLTHARVSANAAAETSGWCSQIARLVSEN